MDIIEAMRPAITLRDELLEKYTSKENRVPATFMPFQDAKENVSRVNGYSSIDFYVGAEYEEQLKEEMKNLISAEAELIRKSGLYFRCEERPYEEKNENGEVALNPDIKNLRYVFELHEGDYDRLTNLLSEAEEEGMLNSPSASKLNEDDRSEYDDRLNYFRPGKTVIKR